MSPLVDRASFRSRVALATATLLVLIAGHAVRETARDALFLADLPATSLPWAYLAIAAGAAVLGVANRLLLHRLSHRRLLVGTLVGAVAVDVAFWSTGDPSTGTLFALYAWTGLLGTAVTLQLWLHLAAVFDVGEAKRAFPWVAAGGLLGAVLGSVLAGALLLVIDTNSLLLASAALLLVSAAVAMALPSRREAPEADEDAGRLPLHQLAGSRYLVRITLLGVAVAVLATGIDFLFKLAVARTVPTDDLGHFFAQFNATVNAAALLFELVVASWLLRTLGVTRTLALFPALLLFSAGAFVAFGGLATALLLKALDGTLRPSLHQASTEVLYQPLSAQARNAAKTAAESIGKRGGQAIASLAILGVASAELDPRQIGLGLVGVALLALLALSGLRREYVARFRERLRGLVEETRSEMPRLELHSLETLVSSLSSPDDGEVLRAIELLEGYGRASLIPPLLLHHPSRRVVLRALELLHGAEHPHLDGLLARLLEHADAEVRAAALNAALARGGADPPLERLLHSDPSPRVRATAVVALAARHDRPEQTRAFLAGLVERSSPEERIAVARALPRLAHAVAAEVAERLIAERDGAEARELAQALSGESALAPEWIPSLIALLGRRGARPAARAALLRMGPRALDALDAALRDPDTEPAVRRHLPRTVHLFRTPAAAEILARHIEHGDPRVRHKILRGLGRLRDDDPSLEIPEEGVARQAGRSLDRAIDMLAFRVGYFAWSRLHDAVGSGDRDLLGEVLIDKEERALERVFRALHVLEPTAEFDSIFEALHRPGRIARASGLELIEHSVTEELRGALLAMVGPEDEAGRLRSATRERGSALARALADALDPDDEAALRDALAPLFDCLLADADPILANIARHRLREVAESSAARLASPRAEAIA